MDAEFILQEMKNFFSFEFPGFLLFDPEIKKIGRRKTYAFYEYHQEKELTIVIYTGIKFENGMKIIAGNKLISLLRVAKNWIAGKNLDDGERNALRLKDFYRKNWEKGIRKRIHILRELLEDIRPCEYCGYKYLIPKSRYDRKGVKYVGYYCLMCGKRMNSTYGICLKSVLHPLLK